MVVSRLDVFDLGGAFVEHRTRVLQELVEGNASTEDLVKKTGMNSEAVNRAIRQLRRAGLVSTMAGEIRRHWI